MTKDQAIKIFGGKSKAARVLGVHPSQVSRWPETLPDRWSDRVVGAAIRLKLKIPKD